MVRAKVTDLQIFLKNFLWYFFLRQKSKGLSDVHASDEGSSMPPKKPLHLGTVFIYFLIHMT